MFSKFIWLNKNERKKLSKLDFASYQSYWFGIISGVVGIISFIFSILIFLQTDYIADALTKDPPRLSILGRWDIVATDNPHLSNASIIVSDEVGDDVKLFVSAVRGAATCVVDGFARFDGHSSYVLNESKSRKCQIKFRYNKLRDTITLDNNYDCINLYCGSGPNYSGIYKRSVGYFEKSGHLNRIEDQIVKDLYNGDYAKLVFVMDRMKSSYPDKLYGDKLITGWQPSMHGIAEGLLITNDYGSFLAGYIEDGYFVYRTNDISYETPGHFLRSWASERNLKLKFENPAQSSVEVFQENSAAESGAKPIANTSVATDNGNAEETASKWVERYYGETRGWVVRSSANSGRFEYCSAETEQRDTKIRLGLSIDRWWLAVGKREKGPWKIRQMEIDGASWNVASKSTGIWSIISINKDQLSAIRDGTLMRLTISGGEDASINFPLKGTAASILKLGECVQMARN